MPGSYLDLFDLTGSSAIVSGGAGDIGQVAVRAFLEQGAAVTIFDRDQRRMDLLAKELGHFATRLHMVCGDIAKSEDLDQLLAQTQFADGIDILVNAAAIQSRQSSFEEFNLNSLDALWSVNARGLIDITQRVIARMVTRGRGSIINLCSIASLTGVKNKMAYSVTKGAIALYTRSLALEVGGRGVRVNGIAPGMIVTQFNRDWLGQNPDLSQAGLRRIPMGRFGEAAELAGVFLLLATNAGSYINGELIVVDGGRLAGA
jgi:NAD(P)-dependent dehydrogenase (short-subunit alcohol dehydrogenase family)